MNYKDYLLLLLSAASLVQSWIIYNDDHYARGVKDGVYSTILYVIDNETMELALR